VAYKVYAPQIPFMNRIGYTFLICLAAAVAVSLMFPRRKETSTIDVTDVDYSTSTGFNIAGVIVVAILVFLYVTFW
jgi:SSS family solute:Na+ symporter